MDNWALGRAAKLLSPLGAEKAREILESILTDKAYERADQH